MLTLISRILDLLKKLSLPVKVRGIWIPLNVENFFLELGLHVQRIYIEIWAFIIFCNSGKVVIFFIGKRLCTSSIFFSTIFFTNQS